MDNVASDGVGGFTMVKDSGKREEWETGSRRDTEEGKGRYDLLPPYAIRRLAQHYQNGAAKYGDRNWEKGQPLSRYISSGLRHFYAILDGDESEDHAAAAAWNAFAFMCTKEWIEQGKLPQELDNMGVCKIRVRKEVEPEVLPKLDPDFGIYGGMNVYDRCFG